MDLLPGFFNWMLIKSGEITNNHCLARQMDYVYIFNVCFVLLIFGLGGSLFAGGGGTDNLTVQAIFGNSLTYNYGFYVSYIALYFTSLAMFHISFQCVVAMIITKVLGKQPWNVQY